jgi:spermidine synthase
LAALSHAGADPPTRPSLRQPPTAGQRFCLKVKEPLHAERSDFQDILVFESTNHGRVLVLDDVIQLTEMDEFSYQEMITHLPMFAHAKPESVLILGAGDGGVLRDRAGVEALIGEAIARHCNGID